MTGRQKVQIQKQATAYNRKTTHDIFLMTMEWLEKCIEVAGYYPDWESRKQIKNNKIKRPDIIGNPKKAERDFSTQLILFNGTLRRNSIFRDELKTEFYKWLGSARIDENNCPEKLKHILYGFNEVLEGRGEKILKDAENSIDELDQNSPEYMEQMSGLFAHIQVPMQNEKEIEQSLKGKTYKDIEIESEFKGGNDKWGEKAFSGIAKNVSSSYQNFHHFPQESQQTVINFGEIIQDVKTNPQNWNVDEITTELGNYSGAKQEILLVNRNARLNDYNNEGKLNFNNNRIYRWENFNSQQRFEIKRAKNISGDYLTDEEIKWVVREVKENPRVWKIGEIDKQTYLIHGSAQIKREEIGTLLHNQRKFNEVEWTEINGAFERAIVIDEIKQNAKLEKGLLVLNRETGERSENEDWFIHKQLKREFDNKTGYLIYVPNLMVRVKDLTEAEQKELNYNKLENTQQVQSQSRSGGGKGSWLNTALWGSFTVISLIGLAFTKTKK